MMLCMSYLLFGRRYLTFCQLVEQSLPRHQLVISALLLYLAMIEHDDARAMTYGAQAMSNYNASTSEFVQLLSNLLLANVVKSTGSLVHEKDGWLRYEGSCYKYALLLSAAETRVSLAHHCVHLHGHLTYVVGYACHLCSSPRIVDGTSWCGDGDIAEDVARKE